jgi:hypothetical protein
MITRLLRRLGAVGFFLAVFIAEVWQALARVGSLERSDAPTGKRTAGCLSIEVEPRATRLEITPLRSFHDRAACYHFATESNPAYVAFMLHGAAGSDWQPLKSLGKILQHTRHENGSLATC